MYKIYNKSLDEALKKFKRDKLSDLTDDELVEICSSQKLAPVYELDNRKRPIKLQRYAATKQKGKTQVIIQGTINRLESENSASFYMDDSFWLERHRDEAKERNLADLLAAAKQGEEVFRAYEDIGFGVWQLKPGEEVELDLSPRYVKEILSNKNVFPQAILLDIKDAKQTQAESLKTKLEEMSFGELQNEARRLNEEKGLNIKFVAIAEEKLRASILQHI